MRKIALFSLLAVPALALAACESEPSFPIDDSNSVTNVDEPDHPARDPAPRPGTQRP